jgi:hypothetical protein
MTPGVPIGDTSIYAALMAIHSRLGSMEATLEQLQGHDARITEVERHVDRQKTVLKVLTTITTVAFALITGIPGKMGAALTS